MCAQAAHASFLALTDEAIVWDNTLGPRDWYCIPITPEIDAWLINGIFTKVVVGCNSEEELMELFTKAYSAGLHRSLVQDAGLTEFHGEPTYTAVAIGPGDPEEIDKITGHLKLL